MGCGAAKTGLKYGEAGMEDSVVSGGTLRMKEVKSGGVNRHQFIQANAGTVTDFYEMSSYLGEGEFGTCCRAQHKLSKSFRCVKSMPRAKVQDPEKFRMEIDIMKMLDHPNICRLYEMFEDKKNIFLIMELCTGGELNDKLIAKGSFSEVETAIVLQQAMRGIFYMHESHITHRDVKPENFLLGNNEPIRNNVLKLIDFGLSAQFEDGVPLKEKCGTPYYVAPEVLGKSGYNEKNDVWSCGVMMHVLLLGKPPFDGETVADIVKAVKTNEVDYSWWCGISEEAKDLNRLMLARKPTDRCSAGQCLSHNWIRTKAPKQNLALEYLASGRLVDRLRKFRSANQLTKAALHVIAGTLDDDILKDLREVFYTLDDDGDGQLTPDEVRLGLKSAGLKEIPADLQVIMEEVDADGSGVIDYTEFLAAALDEEQYTQRDVVMSAFRIFDRDGDGKISEKDLDTVLADEETHTFGAKEMAKLLMEFDQDGDGEIDFDEFMDMLVKGSCSPILQWL